MNNPDNQQLLSALSERRKDSMSKWTLPRVLNYFKMEVKVVKVPLFVVPDVVIAEVTRETQKLDTVYGPRRTGGESKRQMFINTTLVGILEQFQGRLQIYSEEALESTASRGKVEFCIKALGALILVLVEAKKDDFDQGYAQLILEMHAAYEMNKARGFVMPVVRGIVSNASGWAFCELCVTSADGETDYAFSQTDIFNVDYASAQDLRLSEVKIMSALSWMLLQGWADTQNTFVETYTNVLKDVDSKLKKGFQTQLDAACLRQTNATAVLQAAQQATNNEEAMAAMAMLQATLQDPVYYPKVKAGML
eukprot:TRINITY_DN21371_c0_g1_i1.p1 TRINITY_DN21371_c0_g1~~TRINITY_DN21371_c0_g1_i1.p1  ORF type:complete len:361 (+),score=77.47 TRINITY_DN21371_c0_g1_i1:160-1083(+)